MPSKKKPTQTANARYRVHVPTHDPHGNLLVDLSPAAHQWLAQQLRRKVHSIHTEGPYPGHQDPYQTFRHLNVLAYDSPEADSYVKQLAAHIGQLANHQMIFVSKEGENPGAWTIANRHYDGGSGHPAAIAFQADPNQTV